MTSERNPERGSMSQNNEKSAPTETVCLTIDNAQKVSSIRQWKKCTTFIVDTRI